MCNHRIDILKAFMPSELTTHMCVCVYVSKVVHGTPGVCYDKHGGHVYSV